MRYIKKADCYFDTQTGLEWSLENYSRVSWHKAVDVCVALGDGWRLPSIEELNTLLKYTMSYPATELPDMSSSSYWSSTTYVYGTDDAPGVDFYDCAWGIDFYDGYCYGSNKSNNFYVRCVRGGPLEYKT